MYKTLLPLLLVVGFMGSLMAREKDTTAPWERNDGFYDNTNPRRQKSAAMADEDPFFSPDVATRDNDIAQGEVPAQGESPAQMLEEEEPETAVQKKTSVMEEVAARRPMDLDDVIRHHAEILKKESRLHWKGSRGTEPKGVNMFSVYYECYHAMTVEEARKLLVYATESLLKTINDLPEPPPQLGHWPLEPQDIDVRICFDNFYGQYLDRQYVKDVTKRGLQVHYSSFSCLKYGKCLIRNETYKDAYMAVKFNLELENTELSLDARRTEGEGVVKVIPFDNIGL